MGCLRNEHLLALLLNADRQMTPSAASVVDNFYDSADAVVKVKVQLPPYFYSAWVACRLVPADKDDPDGLPPNTSPDCRPANTGHAERRLITCTYFEEALNTVSVFNLILGPVQNGVGTQGGISITDFAVY